MHLIIFAYINDTFAQKNVGRVMANEKEVVAVLQEGNMMKLNVVDTAKMTYLEQLKVSIACALSCSMLSITFWAYICRIVHFPPFH